MDDLALSRILTALALAIAGGCSGRAISDGSDHDSESDEDDEETSSSSGASTSTSTSTSTSSSTAGTSEEGGDEDVRFDVPHPHLDVFTPPPVLPPEDCYDPNGGAFACDVEAGPGQLVVYHCLEDSPADCTSLTEDEVLDAGQMCLGWPCEGGFVDLACGPDPKVADACCYWLVYEEAGWCPGRPFVVDGLARLAKATTTDAWQRPPVIDLDGLDPIARRRLAEAWTECGLFEHASVASFSRFVLQLLHAGAPARMLRAAHRALAEELEHARVCFGLAAAYVGHPVGPSALAAEGALEIDGDEAVLAATREGCIGETVSALHIAVAAEQVADPIMRAELQRIASEERSHAALAWRFVRWSLRRASPSLRRRVADVFREPWAHVPRGPTIGPGIDDATLRAHGMLPAAQRRALSECALVQLVAPAAAALFERTRVVASY